MNISKLKHWELWWDDSSDEEDNGFGEYPFINESSSNRQMIAPKWSDEWWTFNRLYDMTNQELENEISELIESYNMQLWESKISKNQVRWLMSEFLKYKDYIKSEIENGNRINVIDFIN